MLLVFPWLMPYEALAVNVLVFGLYAVGFNLVFGYTGMLSFGHAAYFGMGSYVAAWTMKFWHVDAIVAIALGGLMGLPGATEWRYTLCPTPFLFDSDRSATP